MDITLRPLDVWPNEAPLRRDYQRTRSPFSATYSSTMGLLNRELAHLHAKRVVLLLAVGEGAILRDGTGLKANVRGPDHPGVVLAFESKHGALKYATDVFTHWEANLRAIALGLEALRKVERYGIGGRGEQYQGWKALPSGIAMGSGPSFESVDDAASFIIEKALDVGMAYSIDDVLEADGSPGAFYKDACRHAAKACHPDTGGSDDLYVRLTAAERMIEGR